MAQRLTLANVRIVGGPDTPVTVAIKDGRIESIVDASARATGTGERLDLGGRFLMPGMWDHHVHFTQWSRTQGRLDLSDTRSAAQVAALVAEQVAMTDAAVKVIGFGYRDALWPDLPTAEMLDAVAPDRPVILLSGDLHSAWVNTAAQVHYELFHAGLLREEEAFVIETHLAEEAHDNLHPMTANAASVAASRGVVGIVDLEMDDNLVVWANRVADGVTSVRVRAGFYKGMLDEIIDRGHRTGDVIDGTNGLLTVGPLKVISDGSLNTRTAYCHDPYPGTADFGMNNVPPDQLVPLMEAATANGIDVAIHAIGDLANTLALDAFEATGARGSIEHAQLLQEADIPRFAQLGVVASVQPAHAFDDRDVADSIWEGRTDRAFPLHQLHAAGARLALGSDAPVARLDPWATYAAAIDRHLGEREPWHPEQVLPRNVALDASTGGARVVPGAIADLVVCEENPLTASADAVRRMPIAATILGGNITHRAGTFA